MRCPPLCLLLGFLLCTSVRAQDVPPVNELNEATNIAFIKPVEGDFPADSITIRTSLDTLPYGFAFNRDTVFLDVAIFPPVDEITVELLANDKSFGRYSFWVDAPTANVHLSVAEEKTRVDSVTLSGVNTWFRGKLTDLGKSRSQFDFCQKLVVAAAETSGGLMSLTFADALLNQPFVSSSHLYDLKEYILPGMPFLLKNHPRYNPVEERAKLINTRPVNFKKMTFLNADDEPVRILPPKQTEYYVIDLYSLASPQAERVHQEIKSSPELDSLFTQVAPLISISNDPSPAIWGLYVTDNAFSWNHYIEDARSPQRFSARIPLGRRPLYLLMNRKDRVRGVFFDFKSLVTAVLFNTGK